MVNHRYTRRPGRCLVAGLIVLGMTQETKPPELVIPFDTIHQQQ